MKKYKESRLPHKLRFSFFFQQPFTFDKYDPFVIGIVYRFVAEIYNKKECVRQFRIKLICFMLVVTWES